MTRFEGTLGGQDGLRHWIKVMLMLEMCTDATRTRSWGVGSSNGFDFPPFRQSVTYALAPLPGSGHLNIMHLRFIIYLSLPGRVTLISFMAPGISGNCVVSPVTKIAFKISPTVVSR